MVRRYETNCNFRNEKDGIRVQALISHGLTFLSNILSFNNIDKFVERIDFLSRTGKNITINLRGKRILKLILMTHY